MGVLYEHWRPDLNECFYVGISWGQEETRPWQMSKRNCRHRDVQKELNKKGLKVEVRVQEFLNISRERLCNLEKLMIAHWRQYIENRLTNLTLGGEGVFVTWDEELKNAQGKKASQLWNNEDYRSRQKKTRSDPDWIKNHSELQSKLKKGKPVFFLHTPEAIAKRAKKHSDARKGKSIKHLPGKPVINLMTGEKFETASAATIYYGIKRKDSIADSCRQLDVSKKRRVGSHKYRFSYICDLIDYKPTEKKD